MTSHISFRLFILLSTCAIRESREANEIDQTDLHKAFRNTRIRSYHGFVILLRMMNVAGYLQNLNVTFLMPDNGDISQLPINQRNLQDFVLSHTIPAMFKMDDLLHLPNGTLVPTSLPKRMISITVAGNSGLNLNNARIVTPNVCLSSFIRCHGISSTITFEIPNSSTLPPVLNLQSMGLKSPGMTKNQAADNRTVQGINNPTSGIILSCIQSASLLFMLCLESEENKGNGRETLNDVR